MTLTPHLDAELHAHLGALELRISLAVGSETLLIVGPNGSGKTSLLRLLLGVEAERAGRVILGGRVLTDPTRKVHVPTEERRMGYVPQDYGLFPHLTVEQHLEFALESLPRARRPLPQERTARVSFTLESLDLHRQRTAYPFGLSGGERQRLALGRALIGQPLALLLDEPLAALDALHRAEVRQFLAHYLERVGLPTLLVTHDREDARYFPGKIAVLEAGRIVQLGSWSELEERPASDFVRRFTKGDATGALHP
jgi:molybdate transport system ATP-binding protein